MMPNKADIDQLAERCKLTKKRKGSVSRSLIHYNPERIDYSLNEEEMQLIRNAAKNDWKDLSFLCFGLSIPCLLNAVSEFLKQSQGIFDWAIYVNFLIGSISAILGTVFLIAWMKSKTDIDEIFERIRNKPVIELSEVL